MFIPLANYKLKCAKQAFTIVEMLVVVVIIAIIAGGAIVSLRGRKDIYAIQVSAYDLASALRFAAGQARMKQTRCRVALDSSRKQYQVERIAAGSMTETDFTPVIGKAGTVKKLAEGVEIIEVSQDGREIHPLPDFFEFNDKGPGFYGRIKLQNRLGDRLSIEVLPETRQVHVLE